MDAPPSQFLCAVLNDRMPSRVLGPVKNFVTSMPFVSSMPAITLSQ
jgi:hypothetical protein